MRRTNWKLGSRVTARWALSLGAVALASYGCSGTPDTHASRAALEVHRACPPAAPEVHLSTVGPRVRVVHRLQEQLVVLRAAQQRAVLPRPVGVAQLAVRQRSRAVRQPRAARQLAAQQLVARRQLPAARHRRRAERQRRQAEQQQRQAEQQRRQAEQQRRQAEQQRRQAAQQRRQAAQQRRQAAHRLRVAHRRRHCRRMSKYSTPRAQCNRTG